MGRKLCYPTYFIDSAFRKAKKTFYHLSDETSFNCENILCLPFYVDFNPLIKILKRVNINVVFNYGNSIKIFLVKNRPTELDIGGVYYIPCNMCNKVYIGQSGKQCCKRLAQHKYNVRTANESSGIFIHMRDYNHSINWGNSDVIFKSNDVYDRLIIESCLIESVDNMNMMPGSFKVDNIIKKNIFEIPKVRRALASVKPP